jgi:NSS family neurotransmitter:Na+ symporter
MAGGTIFGPLFFILLAFAAVTSIIALLEPIIAYAEDKLYMSRKVACVLFGFLAWAVGLATVFSFNIWSDVTPLDSIKALQGKTLFDLIDYFTANLMMPLGGILMALFVGWRIRPETLREDLQFASPALFTLWLWMIRVVAPAAILWVLYTSL